MIQFQCEVCGGFLRVTDGKAGKTIVCKLCGSEVEVPDTSFAEEPQASEGGEGAEASQGDDLFAGVPESKDEIPRAPQPADFAAPPDDEKEEEPTGDALTLPLPDMTDPVNRKLLIPSLVVLGTIIASMLTCVLYVVVLAIELFRIFFEVNYAGNGSLGFGVIMTILVGVYHVIALSCAVHLVMRIDFHKAYAAAILVMLPCGPCCIVGLPAGIWAIRALHDEEVRRSFKE